VNYADEAVNMIEAQIGVKANVKALQTEGETLASLIDIFV
jgi:flagellar hook protein FlgE